MKPNLNRAWAILFARLVFGLIFFMAGVMKVFQLSPFEHARKYFLPFSDTFLPIWSLWVTGVAIPFVELIAGALVLLGLRTRDALIVLGTVLVIVTFGHLLRDALFNFSGHVIPRLGNTNSGREVKGDGDVPSKIGMDTKHHGRGGGVDLAVCLRMMNAATDKLRAALAPATNAARYLLG
jgi:uncharacterized membrane protein YphA (DoxX/SURF4 family)